MIDFLLEHAPHTPQLFETRVAAWRVTALSKVLDEYQVRFDSGYARGCEVWECIYLGLTPPNIHPTHTQTHRRYPPGRTRTWWRRR